MGNTDIRNYKIIMRKGIIPKEGGILGVWLSTLIYGVILAVKSSNGLSLSESITLIAALAALPASGLALRSEPGWSRMKYILPITILYLPILYDAWPHSIYYLIAVGALLFGAIIARGLPLILIGGPLIAGIGGALALTSGHQILALLPITYSIMTVAIAGAGVSKLYRGLALPSFLGGIGVIIAAAALYEICNIASIVLVLDVGIRLGLYPLGVYDKVSLKLYGFHEAFHSLLVLALVAYCI
ncbi:MAG: hypothetical protein F7B78_04285 [Desulfurococcales archaeon]|nr:hypothetical protein [Desulfurococcales archaeon]